jgi:hypothetical protein
MRRTQDRRALAASLLMVAFAVGFNLYIIRHLFDAGVNDAGDDQYHMSQSYYMRRLIVEEHALTGVVDALGLGYPWFNTHQFLMYAAEAALNLVSLGLIPLLDAHKLVLALSFSLFPVAVHFLLDRYRQPPIMCGLGALLSVTPISGWGHSTTAYFAIGLTSQSLAALLFPFALGCFHELLAAGGGARRTGLLYALVLFAHPYYAFFLGFLSLAEAAASSIALWDVRLVLRRAAPAAAIALLVCASWLAALPEAVQYAPRNLYVQAARESFSPGSAAYALLTGQLLDVTDNFGDAKDTNLRWPMNAGSGRLPVLTALALLGIIFPRTGKGGFGAFCIVCLLVSAALLLGSDDVPFLKALPLAGLANAKRAVFLVDLFSVCLAAAALNRILEAVWDAAGRLSPGLAMRTVAAAAALALILSTPYYERAQTASREVNTLSHWIPGFDAMRQAMYDDGTDGRVYGDTETGLNYVTVIYSQPWLLDRTYMRRLYATRFGGDFLQNPMMFGMFNIRYVVASTEREIPAASKPALTGVYSDRLYTLYRVEGDFGWAYVSNSRPALLTTGEEWWRQAAEAWLNAYRTGPPDSDFPVILQGMGGEEGDFRASLDYAPVAAPNPTLATALVAELTAGERAAARQDGVRDERRSLHGYSAQVETPSEAVFAYKVTYHPDWKAYVDGLEARTYRATPEYPAVLLTPGRHTVEFRYEGGWLKDALGRVSAAAVLFALAPEGLLIWAAKALRIG